MLAVPAAQLCGPGEPGELLLSGPRLARGYRGRPDLTADKFAPNPFFSEVAAVVPEQLLHHYARVRRRRAGCLCNDVGRTRVQCWRGAVLHSCVLGRRPRTVRPPIFCAPGLAGLPHWRPGAVGERWGAGVSGAHRFAGVCQVGGRGGGAGGAGWGRGEGVGLAAHHFEASVRANLPGSRDSLLPPPADNTASRPC